jgi:hypothetical protein
MGGKYGSTRAFDRFNVKISGWMEWIGFAHFSALVTTIDVMGSKLFVVSFGALTLSCLELIAATAQL